MSKNVVATFEAEPLHQRQGDDLMKQLGLMKDAAPVGHLTRPVSVLFPGPQSLYRSAVRALLACSPGVVLIEENESISLTEAVMRSQPDVLLIDSDIDVSAISHLLERQPGGPKMRLIVLAESVSDAQLLKAAHSVVPTMMTPAQLVSIIQREGSVPSSAAGVVVALPSSHDRSKRPLFGLTDRELEIIRAVTEAQPNKDISEKLGISIFTVKHYITRIFDKLGVYNRVELALFAVAHQLAPEMVLSAEKIQKLAE